MKRVLQSSLFNPFPSFSQLLDKRNLSVIETKIVHAHVIKSALFQSDVFIANSLVDSYCNSGLMYEAHNLFVEIPQRNIVSWNIVLSGYNQGLQFGESRNFFCKMHSSEIEPNQFTYGGILSACTICGDLKFGQQIYSLVLKNGFSTDGYVRTGMIELFSKNDNFDDALEVFFDAQCDNIVCWNATIAGAVRNREHLMALEIFYQMFHVYLMPNCFTVSSILTACAAAKQLDIGKAIHGLVVKCGMEGDIFIGTSIIDLYIKCDSIHDAINNFYHMPNHNVVSWTAFLSGFVQRDDAYSALEIFKEMREIRVEINNYTVTNVLTACAKLQMEREAFQLHCFILKYGLFLESTVNNALIHMYGKIGKIEDAEKIFKDVENVSETATWEIMISACAHNQLLEKSIELFCRMLYKGLYPGKFGLSSVLGALMGFGELGKQIHSYVFKSGLVLDISVASSLFTMYSKCGIIDDAYRVFHQMPIKDGISWTSMIAGFAEFGYSNKAFGLFREMGISGLKPDQIMLSSVLTACSSQFLLKGKEIHGYSVRVCLSTDTTVGSSLINMYSRCRYLVYARRVFNQMTRKDMVSWSSMVSGYAQNGYNEDAFFLFHSMMSNGLEIDHVLIASLVSIATSLTRPDLGKQLHGQAVKTGLETDLTVSSSMLSMYSKCGNVEESQKVFDQIETPDLVAWTTMIACYAYNGHGTQALRTFEMMREKGIKPDSVTFVGILTACSHNGLLEEAYSHLNSMSTVYGIEPQTHHYACMVDLIGRLGRLQESLQFIQTMPISPDGLVWSALLGVCKVHGDVEIGKIAAKKVLELSPNDDGAYVSLSNIYAGAGEWEKALNIRSSMKCVGMKKEPGWSLV